jgi:hypothetical protein
LFGDKGEELRFEDALTIWLRESCGKENWNRTGVMRQFHNIMFALSMRTYGEYFPSSF